MIRSSILRLAVAVSALALIAAAPPPKPAAKPSPPSKATAKPAPQAAAAKKPAPPKLSAFQQEQKMSYGQMMRRWYPDITAASKRFNVPVVWVRAVMQVESGGRTMTSETQGITSRMGAMGLMQLMPETWAEMRAAYKLGNDPYNPQDNITAGVAYLKVLKGKYGYPEMFAAYNDGPGHLDQRMRDAGLLPQETRDYLAKVTGVVEGRGPGLGGQGVVVKFTKPNGGFVMINVAAVRNVRAAFPDEYAGCVQSVITVGRVSQGVCEALAKARSLIRGHGGAV